MALTAMDMLVLLAVGGAAVWGARRGFVAEVLSLFAWVASVFALKLFHEPLTHALIGPIGTVAGAAVLAFAILTGVTFAVGKLLSRTLATRTRTSVLGPLDRALGFGFGTVKGLILASLAFLLVALVVDTARGGPARRPEWMTRSRTYRLLDATSAGVADVIDRRRHGEPLWGPKPPRKPDAAADNASEAS